jgi:hypothetical protein
MVGAWTTFIVNEAYAITSGLGYLSVKNPTDTISDPYLSIMSALIVVMVPFLVLTMVAVQAYAAPEHKSYSRAALAFMVMLGVLTSSVNFALFVAARQPALAQSLGSMAYVTTGWPPLLQIMDTFAWDWFFALSMLIAAPVFRGGRLQNATRAVMVISGVICILGLVWLPFSPSTANWIGIVGWGVAGPIAFLLLANLFTRIQPDESPYPAG